jgi:HlyD family secretion protein
MAQRSRTLTRRLAWLAIVAIAAVGLAVVMRPSPVPVDAVAIQRGALRVTLTEEGETRVADRFVVSAPLAGRVLRLELRAGDPVVANRTIVARLLPAAPALLDTRTRAELTARVQAAEAAAAQARAELARVSAEHAQAERVQREDRRVGPDRGRLTHPGRECRCLE